MKKKAKSKPKAAKKKVKRGRSASKASKPKKVVKKAGKVKKKKVVVKAKKKVAKKKAASKPKAKGRPRKTSEKEAPKKKSASKAEELPKKKAEGAFNPRVGFGEERRKRPRDTDSDRVRVSEEQTLNRTPMKIYLEQIEHIPLLTPEEEIELAEKVQAKRKGSEDARHRMIRCNLRLVISIAKRYSNMGLPFSDLVEEGNIGLMRAVEKFNPERGYRFSTYASWWIKQAIMRALSNQGKTIRIPVYMYDVISKWRKVRDGLTQRLNRAPTHKEIADYMKVPVTKVREIENIAGRPSSLNAPVSMDGNAELADLIPDEESKGPEVKMGDMMKNQRIYQLLERLDDREKRILILRFGLQSNEPQTLEEVAGEFDITRERVRQIEALALSKVRQMFIEEDENVSDYLN